MGGGPVQSVMGIPQPPTKAAILARGFGRLAGRGVGVMPVGRRGWSRRRHELPTTSPLLPYQHVDAGSGRPATLVSMGDAGPRDESAPGARCELSALADRRLVSACLGGGAWGREAFRA